MAYRSPVAPAIAVGIGKRGWCIWKVRYKCGHRDAPCFRLYVDKETMFFSGQRDRCPVCMAAWICNHARACDLCEEPILPGETVALYGTSSSGFSVGCMRMGCGVLTEPRSVWDGVRVLGIK